MKSAFERAMERADKLGTLSPEELKRLEYLPQGNTIAARYLKEENYDLEAELTRLKGSGIRRYVIEGAHEILLRNISLPRDSMTRNISKRAISGMKVLKENKKALNVIADRLEQLFSYYEQARQQAYVQLKQNFEARLNQAAIGLEKQLLGTQIKVNVEGQPQFQEEWRRLQSNLDQQYGKALEEQRQEIANLS